MVSMKNPLGFLKNRESTSISGDQRLKLSYFQKAKTVFHIIQGVLIFVVWCMTIAVIRGADTDGRTSFLFAVVRPFITVHGHSS